MCVAQPLVLLMVMILYKVLNRTLMQALCLSNRSVIKHQGQRLKRTLETKCNVNEIFLLETGTAEIVNTVLQNPYWLNGKDVTYVENATGT